MFLPYITGDWHSSNLHNNIHATASSLGASSFTLVIVWLYAMCWSSYGMECCATFAPEYHDTARDTPKALRVAAHLRRDRLLACCRWGRWGRSATRT